jgi:hypothetical protein
MEDMYGGALVQVMGHCHKLLVASPQELLSIKVERGEIAAEYINRKFRDCGLGWIPKDERWYCMAGSFQAMYQMGRTSFPERIGSDPAELGYLVMTVQNDRMRGIERVPIGVM